MGRGRVRGGRAEGVPGRARPPRGVPEAGPRGKGALGLGVPRRVGGRALEAAASCLPECGIRAIYGLERRLRCPFAGLPASRAAPGAEARGWTAAGEGPRVRPGACGSPALEGVESGGGAARTPLWVRLFIDEI